MNIAQARRLPLETLLALFGHEPQRRRRDELWYLSPFRQESEPSFKVHVVKNVWYDFGEGIGGDVIDFVRRLHELNSVSEALRQLEQLMSCGQVRPAQSPAVVKDDDAASDIEVTRIGPVRARSLIEYLKQRAIDPKRATEFVQELHYRRDGRDFFALEFANDSGGYELRSRYFKGSHGVKDITTFWNAGNTVLVFEGFFDFLTAVTSERQMLSATAIVLNSTALWQRATKSIQQMHDVETVRLYRDNDPAGEQLLARFRQALPKVAVTDMAHLYIGSKDLNEHAIPTVRSRTI